MNGSTNRSITFANVANSNSKVRKLTSEFNELCLQNISTILSSSENITEEHIERMKREERIMENKMRQALRNYERLIERYNNSISVRTNINIKDKKQYRYKTNVKSRALSRADGAKTCDECCSICSNIHVMSQSCVTDCGHKFGGECYTKWMECCKAQSKNVTCPICRAENKGVTIFRERKLRVSKTGVQK